MPSKSGIERPKALATFSATAALGQRSLAISIVMIGRAALAALAALAELDFAAGLKAMVLIPFRSAGGRWPDAGAFPSVRPKKPGRETGSAPSTAAIWRQRGPELSGGRLGVAIRAGGAGFAGAKKEKLRAFARSLRPAKLGGP